MHKTIDGAFSRRLDIDQPVMGPNFEMFPTVLIGKRAPQNTKPSDPSRKWYRTSNVCSCPSHRFHNFAGRAVQTTVVKRL